MAEVVRTYYDTGELNPEVYNVNGKYKYYYENGQLKDIYSYTDDKMNG